MNRNSTENNRPPLKKNTAESDDEYFNSFPPGYRFCPLDSELFIHYLKKKVMNEPLPYNGIKNVNIYAYSPEEIAEKYKPQGKNEWYFFTSRNIKYKNNGKRPDRAAGDGFWKAIGSDEKVEEDGATLGFLKTLVFYKGKPQNCLKTDWVMHEFFLQHQTTAIKMHQDDLRLNEVVLCRICKQVKKHTKDNKRQKLEEDNENPTSFESMNKKRKSNDVEQVSMVPHPFCSQNNIIPSSKACNSTNDYNYYDEDESLSLLSLLEPPQLQLEDMKLLQHPFLDFSSCQPNLSANFLDDFPVEATTSIKPSNFNALQR